MQKPSLLLDLTVNTFYVVYPKCNPFLVRVGTAFLNPKKQSWWVLSKS